MTQVEEVVTHPSPTSPPPGGDTHAIDTIAQGSAINTLGAASREASRRRHDLRRVLGNEQEFVSQGS